MKKQGRKRGSMPQTLDMLSYRFQKWPCRPFLSMALAESVWVSERSLSWRSHCRHRQHSKKWEEIRPLGEKESSSCGHAFEPCSKERCCLEQGRSGGQGGGAGTCRESGVAPKRRWCPRKAYLDFQDSRVRGYVKCPGSLRGAAEDILGVSGQWSKEGKSRCDVGP